VTSGPISGRPAVMRSVSLVTGDVARARRLFADVLGGRPVTTGAAELVWFAPGFAVELVDRDGLAPDSPLWLERDGAACVTLVVDEPAQALEQLARLGYRVAAAGESREGSYLCPPPGVAGLLRLVLADRVQPPPTDLAPALVRTIDHVCAATSELATAVAALTGPLGGAVVFGGDNVALGTRAAQVRFAPGVKVELLEPRREGLALGSFLTAAHPRLHHVTFMTDDLPGCIETVAAAGWTVIDVDLDSHPTWQEAWIRPRESFGLLVQLVESPLSYPEPLDPRVTAGVLAGRVNTAAYRMLLPPDLRPNG